jgi:hypothetical protein
MSIKLFVEPGDVKKIKKLGACWLPDVQSWVIPDGVRDINPFRDWLPDEEGFIVQRPFFVVRTKRLCVECGKETPLVAPGIKSGYELAFDEKDRPVWRRWDLPMLFTEVVYMDPTILQSMQENYPFFQWSCSPFSEEEDKFYYWANTCIHCQAVQDDLYNFSDGDAPLAPCTMEDARKLRVVYFKLPFDYYIQTGFSMDPIMEEILGAG